MHSVSVLNIIMISLKYGCCWNILQPPLDRLNTKPTDIPNSAKFTKVTKHRFQQPLDHFDANEKRTFQMPYYQRLDMWKPNSPIYLVLKRDYHNLHYRMLSYDCFLPVILAQETNGSLFLAGQRYYTDEMKLPHDKDFFKFLNTTQSLADIADFIKFLKSDPNLHSSKVVIIGYTDMGTLGTWFRMHYPDLVDAVVAIKAPLLAEKEYTEFYDIVHNAYDKYGNEDCISNMEYYFHTQGTFFNNASGIEMLQELFDVCKFDDFTMSVDRQWFMRARYSDYFLRVWFDDPEGMIAACDTTPAPDELVNMNSLGCYDFHVDNWTWTFYSYPNIYQICSEFGRFETTNSEKQPFVNWNPLDYFFERCEILFGIDEQRIDRGISETNRMFGGLSPNVTNVVFLWAEMDLYRELGVQKNLSDSAPAFVVSGMSYYNILARYENEPKDLTETRNRVISLVKDWIGFS